MTNPSEITELTVALEAIEDLLGILQDLHYRLESTDDLADYGVIEALLSMIDRTLERYDSLD